MKCNSDNCLNCKKAVCVLDLQDAKKTLRKSIGDYEKNRHARYYQEHKVEIDAKQKERDKKYKTSEWNHAYYLKHKAEINQKNRERYQANKEERIAYAKQYYYEHRDEINAKARKKYADTFRQSKPLEK